MSRAIGVRTCTDIEQLQRIDEAVQIDVAIGIRHVHANGIGVGVHTDQQQIDRRAAAEAVLDRGLESDQSLETGGCGLCGIRTVRGTAFVRRIDRAEVIRNEFQIARRRIGGVRPPFAEAQHLGLDPFLDAVLDVEHRAGIRLATHRAMRQTQHVADHMRETTVRARRDVQRVEAAGLQEAIKARRIVCGQRIVGKELVTESAVGRERAPCIQPTHVELLDPGIGEDVLRQFETEFATRDRLRQILELALVLQGRDLAQHRHDVVERGLYALFVVMQAGVLAAAHQRMTTHGPGPAGPGGLPALRRYGPGDDRSWRREANRTRPPQRRGADDVLRRLAVHALHGRLRVLCS